MAKEFYCPYCNLICPSEEKTDEHFIPKSVGGKWEIQICVRCNSHCGKHSDAFFAKTFKAYSYFYNSIIEGRAQVYFKKGGREVCDIKLKEIPSNKHHLIFCRGVKSGLNYRQSEIEKINFIIIEPGEIQYTIDTQLKITLGGIFHLLMRNGLWNEVNQNIFKSPIFNLIRNRILATDQVVFNSPAKEGTNVAYTVDSYLVKEGEEFLKSRKNPDIRRHYISLENQGENALFRLMIFGSLFWGVTVHKVNFQLKHCIEDELMLVSMNRVPPESALNIMYMDRTLLSLNL